MRDPYLYEDVDVLMNIPQIKDVKMLEQVEADITNIAMIAMYNLSYENYDSGVLKELHLAVFGQLYEWAGEFRSIQISKAEVVLGGASVDYTKPKCIEKELKAAFNELSKLYSSRMDDKEKVFRLTRIIARIWHIHPFREGNTRTVILLLVLVCKKMGFGVDYNIFSENASYVRHALVWCTQGMYSKYEYLETIIEDAVFGCKLEAQLGNDALEKYKMIGNYKVEDYVPTEHKYKES